MRDQPFVVGGVAREAAAEMIVDAALAHAVERDGDGVAQPGVGAVAQPAAPQQSRTRRAREISAPGRSRPTPGRIPAAMRSAIWSSSVERDQRTLARDLDRLVGRLLLQRLQEAGAVGLDVLRLVAEGLGDALQHVDEAWPAVPRGMGK